MTSSFNLELPVTPSRRIRVFRQTQDYRDAASLGVPELSRVALFEPPSLAVASSCSFKFKFFVIQVWKATSTLRCIDLFESS